VGTEFGVHDVRVGLVHAGRDGVNLLPRACRYRKRSNGAHALGAGGACSISVSNVLGGSPYFPKIRPGTISPGNLYTNAK
jgi:hypothetical protein